MDYYSDNKIWRVICPLLAYFGIRIAVESCFYVGVWYVKFKELDINAAFNGITYVEEYGMSMDRLYLVIACVSAIITIPVMYYLMKKDYQYPKNRYQRERVFLPRKYLKEINYRELLMTVIIGAVGASGLSRLIGSLPFDGILGDYESVKQMYAESNIVLQIIVLGIASPVVEEFIFRGIAYKRLKVYYDVTTAAYISCIMFAVAHFNLIQGIYAFVMGIVLTILYEKKDCIIYPMAMHMAANMASVISGINPVSEMIDRYIIIKLIVGVAQTTIFVLLIIRENKKECKK